MTAELVFDCNSDLPHQPQQTHRFRERVYDAGKYVDEHKVSLSDPVARWLPALPEANRVTLKMLANMTSGYPGYVTDPKFIAEFYQNPFHLFTEPQPLPSPSRARCLSRRGQTGATRTPTW